MKRKTEMWTMFQGVEFAIGPTDCGQVVVKLTPAEWDRLPPNIQDTIIAIDILLAKEWALVNTSSAELVVEGERIGVKLCSR